MKTSQFMSIYLASVLLTAEAAIAKSAFDAGLLIQSDGQGDSDAGTGQTDLWTNLNWNWNLAGEFFIGGKLILSVRRTTATSSTTVLTTYMAPGLNIGYGNDDQGFRLGLFATLSPTERSSGDFAYARYGGIGFGLDASYLVKARSFGIGPKLTYLVDKHTHEILDGRNSKLSEPAERTRLIPQIVAVWQL